MPLICIFKSEQNVKMSQLCSIYILLIRKTSGLTKASLNFKSTSCAVASKVGRAHLIGEVAATLVAPFLEVAREPKRWSTITEPTRALLKYVTLSDKGIKSL